MNELFPIIRRKRRPLIVEVAECVPHLTMIEPREVMAEPQGIVAEPQCERREAVAEPQVPEPQAPEPQAQKRDDHESGS